MTDEQKVRLNKRVEEQCTTLEEALSEGLCLVARAPEGGQIRIYAVAFPGGIGIGYSNEGYSEREIETYLDGVLDVLEAVS